MFSSLNSMGQEDFPFLSIDDDNGNDDDEQFWCSSFHFITQEKRERRASDRGALT